MCKKGPHFVTLVCVANSNQSTESFRFKGFMSPTKTENQKEALSFLCPHIL